MHQNRVVVIGLPPLLSDVLLALAADEPGLRIVAVLPAGTGLAAAAIESAADVLVVMPEAGGAAVTAARWAETVAALLERCPRLRAVALFDGGRRAIVHELRPERTRLGDVSPRALLQAAAAGPAWTAAAFGAADEEPGHRDRRGGENEERGGALGDEEGEDAWP